MKEGKAFHDGLSPMIKMGNPGGGMSASENRMVGKRGKIIYNTGAPKSTTDGKDTSRDAKNVIAKIPLNIKEQSPTSWPQSRNRGSHYKGGKGSNAPHKGYK